jgi:hypothetical protein
MRWLDNPFTGEALRQAIDFLVFHFAPRGALQVPANVEASAARMPPEARDSFLAPTGVGHTEAGWLISWIEMDLDQGGRLSRPSPAPARDDTYVPDEWYTYAQLFSDLGSGWDRRQKLMGKESDR